MNLMYVLPQKHVKGKAIDNFEEGQKFGSYHFTKKRCRELAILPIAQRFVNNRFSEGENSALFLNAGEDIYVVIDEKMIDPEMSVYFFAEKKEAFSSLADFALACARKKYRFSIDYYHQNDPESAQYNPRYCEPQHIERCVSYLKPKDIDADHFIRKREYINDYLNGLFTDVLEEDIKAATVLEDEWNSIFICAELSGVYVGYWWQTTA